MIRLCHSTHVPPTRGGQEAEHTGGKPMGAPRTQAGIGGAIYFVVIVGLGIYFTFASVQGDYGLFQRIQIEAETQSLRKERDALSAQITALTNKTHRLSDDYLDLDLLDEQARSVLGFVRADEIVLR